MNVTVSAAGDAGTAALKRVSKRTAPEMEQFLVRYLAVAFDPASARDGFKGLAQFFEPDVRAKAGRDQVALSLGKGGGQLTEVRTRPAGARVVFLIERGKPLAATVDLRLDGSARWAGGESPISMRSKFSMLRGKQGWKIAAYNSTTKVPQ